MQLDSTAYGASQCDQDEPRREEIDPGTTYQVHWVRYDVILLLYSSFLFTLGKT